MKPRMPSVMLRFLRANGYRCLQMNLRSNNFVHDIMMVTIYGSLLAVQLEQQNACDKQTGLHSGKMCMNEKVSQRAILCSI